MLAYARHVNSLDPAGAAAVDSNLLAIDYAQVVVGCVSSGVWPELHSWV